MGSIRSLWRDRDKKSDIKTPSDVVDDFNRLKAIWGRDTSLKSPLVVLLNHPAYREIISLGLPVIPLMLEDLKQGKLYFWFHAIDTLVGDSSPGFPVGYGYVAKNFQTTAKIFVSWGIKAGYIQA
jgi:hypothetical protein